MSVIIFEGGTGPSPVERWFAGVRRAILLDFMERMLSGTADGLVDRFIVSTDDAELAAALEGLAPETGSPRFHRPHLAIDLTLPAGPPIPSPSNPSPPKPSNPEPSNPSLSRPAFSNPASSNPAPSDPAPFNPVPSKPVPSNPGSSKPTPSKPSPANPALPRFHFGRELRRLVHAWRCERVVVMGGASAPLLQRHDLEAIVQRLGAGQPPGPSTPSANGPAAGVWANNVYSADIVAFTPASALDTIDLPATDNELPFRLHEQAGLPLGQLPRTLGLTFDVDTPTDGLILALHPGAGPRLRRLLGSASHRTGDAAANPVGAHPERKVHGGDVHGRKAQGGGFNLGGALGRLQAAADVLLDRWREAWIAGRISGQQLSFLDGHTRCRLRVFSEERGMKSLGLETRGEVYSLLREWIDAVGPEAFFAALGRRCGAAFIDTRPLFAHQGRTVGAGDRFLSDLGAWESIQDPWVRRFTAAAQNAPVPVVLGGHSLVTGGLWALLEARA